MAGVEGLFQLVQLPVVEVRPRPPLVRVVLDRVVADGVVAVGDGLGEGTADVRERGVDVLVGIWKGKPWNFIFFLSENVVLSAFPVLPGSVICSPRVFGGSNFGEFSIFHHLDPTHNFVFYIETLGEKKEQGCGYFSDEKLAVIVLPVFFTVK